MLSTITLESPVIDLSGYDDSSLLLLTFRPHRILENASDSISGSYRYFIQARAENGMWETIHQYRRDHEDNSAAVSALPIPARFYKNDFQFRFCLGETDRLIGGQCLWRGDQSSLLNNLIDGSIAEPLSLRVGRVAIFDPNPLYDMEDLARTTRGGTSFSAPLVAGAAALLFSHSPALDYRIVKRAILRGVKKVPGLSGDYITSGILSVQGAFRSLAATTPAITVDKPDLQIGEASSRTLNVALTRQPAAEVSVSIMQGSSDDQLGLSGPAAGVH